MAFENSPLTLVVKEKKLGNLVTNAKDIREWVTERIKDYSVEKYQGDAKEAAKAKAELNAAAKKLNDDRILLEREWNLPFQEFKDIVTETTNLIKSASEKLDAIVKAKEEEEKAAKQTEIEKLWQSKNYSLVPLERFYNPKWLNKTYKIATVEADMDLFIKRTNEDLAALEAFGSDTATLKDLYLSTLNLQMTLNKGAELKANRERLAEEEKKRSEQKEVEETKEAVVLVDFKKHTATPVVEKTTMTTEKTYLFNVYGEKNEVDSVIAIAEEMNISVIPSITLKGTITEINKFKELLADNGLAYNKTGIINLEAIRK